MLYPFAYSQQHATTCNGGCIRTQSVTFNNVGSRWPTVLRPFARGFKLRTCKRTQQLPTMLGVVQCCIRLHAAKSLTGFKLSATTPDNTLQHATGCAKCDIQQLMLGVVGQQCCVCLHEQVVCHESRQLPVQF